MRAVRSTPSRISATVTSPRRRARRGSGADKPWRRLATSGFHAPDSAMTGTVYLVGAGPGAADLITVRAANLLARADIVFHDALVDAGTLALATRAAKIAVGKRCGRHATVQRFINKQLIDAAKRHAVVVRLKGGDPMMFGRAQ